MKFSISIVIIFLHFFFVVAQQTTPRDSLLAGTHFEHTCYDVTHYDLSIKLDIEKRTISGSNNISYCVVTNNNRIQLDLSHHLQIDSILFEGKHCTFSRLYDSFFINLPRETTVGEQLNTTVFYHGDMLVAKNPPWDGGFVFSKDSLGNPFIGVACQEIGASKWWPTKELLSDKCDSADMHFEIPAKLKAISNGQFIHREEKGATAIYHWKVTYPINNYNISVTIGYFAHFTDEYRFKKTAYPLDYYVLPENLAKAKKQFKQVKPMLKAYEQLFGPYPFARDGYKLVEAPYAGMEHQSAVAYGNKYENGYLGSYFSAVSKKFDFIIIHESGHEYWGNNICMSDRSDMWIHEGFDTYSELLYIEKVFGKKYVDDYVAYWRTKMINDEALVNRRYSNEIPTSDIYYKGALLLHTIRYLVNDDALFLGCLKAIQCEFALKTVDTPTLIHFMNNYLKRDYTAIFNQYLYSTFPPMLNFTLKPSKTLKGYDFTYKWDGVEEGFVLPVTAIFNKKKITVEVTNKLQTLYIPMKSITIYDFDMSKAYFLVKYE